jgi:hypothetical protein
MKRVLIFSVVIVLLISCEYEEGKIRNLSGTVYMPRHDGKEAIITIITDTHGTGRASGCPQNIRIPIFTYTWEG